MKLRVAEKKEEGEKRQFKICLPFFFLFFSFSSQCAAGGRLRGARGGAAANVCAGGGPDDSGALERDSGLARDPAEHD